MKAIIIAASAIALAAPAFAQGGGQTSASVSGMWTCQMTFAEYNQNGWQSGFTRNFQMTVHSNGNYQVQGVQVGLAGNEPFQSEGQWKVEQNLFSAMGPEILQTTMMGPMQSRFGFFGQIDPQGRVMNYQYPQTPAGQNPQGPRSSYMCEKQGGG